MFEEFFGMKHTPFNSSIPTEALYMAPQVEETLARLDWAVENRLFVTVTSDVGCGKTTTLRCFKDRLDPAKYVFLYLSDSRLRPRWLYNGLLEQIGGDTRFYRGDARHNLHRQLENIRAVQGKTVVTVIDESHLLEHDTIEELRFLLNDNMDSGNPMALILAGQNELWDKLNKQAYTAVRQRIDLKCEIPQFDRAQSEQYVNSHLSYAAGRTDLFTDAALDEIYKYSAGAARAINKACFHSLLAASQRAKRIVDDHLVKLVVETELP
jgi:Type II secretory pathway, component ExeA (predicted ATPase)